MKQHTHTDTQLRVSSQTHGILIHQRTLPVSTTRTLFIWDKICSDFQINESKLNFVWTWRKTWTFFLFYSILSSMETNSFHVAYLVHQVHESYRDGSMLDTRTNQQLLHTNPNWNFNSYDNETETMYIVYSTSSLIRRRSMELSFFLCLSSAFSNHFIIICPSMGNSLPI